jgi:hypothetical protein
MLGRRTMISSNCGCNLISWDGDLDTLGALPPVMSRLRGRRRRIKFRGSIWTFNRGCGDSLKWQRGLQLSGGTPMAAGTIRMKPVGCLAAPLRLDGQIAFRASDDATRNSGPV